MTFLLSSELNRNNVNISLFAKTKETIKDDSGNYIDKEFWRPDLIRENSKITLMKGKIEVDSIEFDNTFGNADRGFYFRFLNFKTRNLENLYIHAKIYYCDCSTKKLMLFEKNFDIIEQKYKTELEKSLSRDEFNMPILEPDM